MQARSSATNIDDYIAEFPPATREVLEEVRALIRATAPGAIETMSYAIPTFDVGGRHLVHFAGYEHHVGFYPTGSGIGPFQDEIDAAGYKRAKGSVQFPLDKPMPTDLMRRMVIFRLGEEAERASKGRKR